MFLLNEEETVAKMAYVNNDFSAELNEIEQFLFTKHFALQQKQEGKYEKFLQYWNGNFGIRVIRDPIYTYMMISDDHQNKLDRWYSAAILRDMLIGPGPDVLNLSDQIRFFKENWCSIIGLFGKENCEESHKLLFELKRARADRVFGPIKSEN